MLSRKTRAAEEVITLAGITEAFDEPAHPQPAHPQPAHQTQRRRPPDARYVAGLMSLDEVGRQIRRECRECRECRAVGVDQADLVIALTDGGAGLQNCLQDALAGLAGDGECILDFYHASEPIHEFARAVWPRDEPARSRPPAGRHCWPNSKPWI